MRTHRRGTQGAAAAFVAAALAGGGLVAAGEAVGAPAAVSSDALRARTMVSTASADARIAAKLKVRLKHPALGTDVAVRVYDPATRKTVFTSQSTEAQLPASNMKLVTAFTALTVLGPDARLPTRVVRGATPGSIVVVGGGDPLMSSADVRTLVTRTISALTAASPTKKRPTGLKVSVDDTLFPKPTRAAGWPSSYGLGEISPVRALARHGVASRDTTTDVMAYFIERLKRAGISVNFVGRTTKRATGSQIAKLAGHRVEQDVAVMLLRSDNQIAETLVRHVALATGRAASWAGASAATRSVLKKAGVPLERTRFVDGSGLSRSNRLTAAALVSLLRQASATSTGPLASVVGSLPVAGRTGTLSSRYRTAPTKCAAKIVKAKTGFIDGVVALSGVARGADGKRRVFSIVANRIPRSTYSLNATRLAVDRLAATVTGCY